MVATVALPPSISPDHEHFHLVFNAVADHYFQKSFVIPAHELDIVLTAHKELGKQPATKKSAPDGNNLDTTVGLGIVGAHRAQLRRKDEERARAAAAKRVAETAALDRQLRARAADKAATEELLSFIARGSNDWEKMSCDKLKSAYRCLTDKQLKDIHTSSGGLKKADVVLAISVYMETYQTPAENIIKPPAADVLPVVEALEEAPAEFAPTLVVEEPAEPPAMVVDEEPAEVPRPRRGIKRPAKFSD